MRLHFPLSVFLASTLIAASSDIDEAFLGNLAEGETHVFKRDATITPRDVELAERDGVDLGQSKIPCFSVIIIARLIRYSVSALDDQA